MHASIRVQDLAVVVSYTVFKFFIENFFFVLLDKLVYHIQPHPGVSLFPSFERYQDQEYRTSRIQARQQIFIQNVWRTDNVCCCAMSTAVSYSFV